MIQPDHDVVVNGNGISHAKVEDSAEKFITLPEVCFYFIGLYALR